MNDQLRQYAKRFDAQSLRERGLIAFSIIVAIGFLWWSYFADPMMKRIETLQKETQSIAMDTANKRVIVDGIRQRIAAGVHLEKETQLTRLAQQLDELEKQLRVETIELIDPERMFQLMNQLIYRDSKLKLISLKRREVKPAIPPANPEEPSQEPGIYRHMLEIELSGNYLDILRYMQSLEALDWKLLWDEIEINIDEHPKLNVKVVMSTLSPDKQWVGI